MNNLLAFVPKMYFPKECYFSNKSLTYLKTIESEQKAFIVSGTFLTKNKEEADKIIGTAPVITQSGEPTEKDLDELVSKVNSDKPAYLIAIGGGSVIDLAKAAKQRLGCKLVTVPTTLGSGAEVSQFAVLKRDKQKVILAGPDLLPDVVIINGSYYTSLGKDSIVFQTFDAMAHALESLVSRSANIQSDQFALMALDGLYRSLEDYLDNGSESTILEKIKMSANLAGLAQSSAATGLAHALAHYFGPDNNLPHAEAVTVFLNDVLTLNQASCDKYQKLSALSNWSADNFIDKLSALFNKSGVKAAKITLSEELEAAAEKVRRDVCAVTNPVPAKASDIIKIINAHL